MSMMVLLQSPEVKVLGIAIVTGNAWRDDEARHALRMLIAAQEVMVAEPIQVTIADGVNAIGHVRRSG